ncbi:MAG: alpha-ketoacid dehydrogenase subunit beta [Thermodesulfobacteriota bacterium]
MAVLTYIEAIRQAMWEEMKRDEHVFILGEDVGRYGGAFKATQSLYQEFGPDRVIDTPISESAIVGAAIGAALMGMRPVAEMQFADFISCAFDQIVNFAAKSYYRWGAKVPLVIRAPSGGGVHGGPFHSQNPEGWFFHVPGLKVVAPSTPRDAKGLLKAAIRDDNPVIYFEHKLLYRRIKEEVDEGDYIVPLGRADIKREGKDLTVLTYGAMLHASIEAAQKVADEGIDAQVVDLRTLLPLDWEIIQECVKKTNRVLIVHEDTKTGGIGAELAATIADQTFEFLDAPIRRVASLDTPVPYSPPLEEYFLPNPKKIAAAMRDLARY